MRRGFNKNVRRACLVQSLMARVHAFMASASAGHERGTGTRICVRFSYHLNRI